MFVYAYTIYSHVCIHTVKCTYLKISWQVSTILVASQSSTLQDLTIAGSSGNAVWHGKVHWGPVTLALDTKMGALGEGSFGQVLLVRSKVRQPGPLNLSAFTSVHEAVATWCLFSWEHLAPYDRMRKNMFRSQLASCEDVTDVAHLGLWVASWNPEDPKKVKWQGNQPPTTSNRQEEQPQC